MIGNWSCTLLISLISLIHFSCESRSLADKPITLTSRLSNSSWRAATRPNSVVHTGAMVRIWVKFIFPSMPHSCQLMSCWHHPFNLLKSAGWENKIVHLSPIKSWNLISPLVVLASKSIMYNHPLSVYAGKQTLLLSSAQPERVILCTHIYTCLWKYMHVPYPWPS